MVNLTAITLISTLFCRWISYSPDELNFEQQNVMLSSMNGLRLEATCGGTAYLRVEFEAFKYCPRKQILKVSGTVKDYLTAEPYDSCSIGNAYINNSLQLKSRVHQTEIDGSFNIEMDFGSNDKLVFFDVGTGVLEISMKEKTQK